MIWILTAMLYWDAETYDYATYKAQTFDTLSECHEFIFWNKVMLGEGLIEKHGQEKPLLTYHYFCKSMELPEV